MTAPAPTRFPPVTPLRVVPPLEEIDLAGAERAAAACLSALGVATDTAATTDTPARMARAYAEMLSPRSFDLTAFANGEGYDELVLARAIPVHSVCKHHMLPFLGVAHVGYLPGQRILGLSKLARVVERFARRPQVLERLTTQIADWLQTHLQPRGVGVAWTTSWAARTSTPSRAWCARQGTSGRSTRPR
jgi:GTP cyclohydrolase I